MMKRFANPITGEFQEVEVNDDGTVKVEGNNVNESLQTPVENENGNLARKNGPSSAAESAKKPKMPRGRPITKETAKKFQLSAARAKRLRKEARMKMLAALTTDMDLGKELLKAMRGQDEKYLGMIEKATRLVGLQHDQSSEAVAQKVDLNAKTDNKFSGVGPINITFTDAKPKE